MTITTSCSNCGRTLILGDSAHRGICNRCLGLPPTPAEQVCLDVGLDPDEDISAKYPPVKLP